VGGLKLIDTMQAGEVKKLVFSSTDQITDRTETMKGHAQSPSFRGNSWFKLV